jgi:hypothetical protein
MTLLLEVTLSPSKWLEETLLKPEMQITDSKISLLKKTTSSAGFTKFLITKSLPQFSVLQLIQYPLPIPQFLFLLKPIYSPQISTKLSLTSKTHKCLLPILVYLTLFKQAFSQYISLLEPPKGQHES